MKYFMRLATCLALSLFLTQASYASACSDAIDAYNDAISDIDSYLKRYARCLQNSEGSDDCSSEFRKLKNAQNDFESAVSEYQSECD